MKTKNLHKYLLAVTLLVLIVISYLSFTRIQRLIKSFDGIDHINQVIIELEKTFSYIKDAETGQRGYLISRDSAFLEPYINADDNIVKSITILDSLVANNEKQKENLKELVRLIDTRFMTLGSLLKKDTGRLVADIVIDSIMRIGMKNMNEIDVQIGVMINSEYEQLQSNEKAKRHYVTQSPWFTFLLALFSIGVIVYAYTRINYQLKKSENIQLALEEKVKELEQSNLDLEEFSYTSSHDLQEPLRKIIIYSERTLSKKTDTLDDEAKNWLGITIVAAERMRGLINDLLSYSRIVNVNAEVFYPTDLNKVINDVESDLQEMIFEKNAVIIKDNLPIVFAIANHMDRLFLNLISNAIKYAKKNVPPVINITCEEVLGSTIGEVGSGHAKEKYYKISIADNGIGFDEKYLSKIFVIFQRLHHNQYNGSGIGLAICKKIVFNHKGFITAESKLNEGSVFHVFLPAKIHA
ncbi:MAG: CHASE3 domain-containing protein [Bacteroidia bacterium]